MSVPVDVEVSITMEAENWAFGSVTGQQRTAVDALSARPAGTDAAPESR